jgi:glycosyltransferase involved in cell wall biosynthesis
MRILALTKYGNLGASSRLRTLQYLPGLRQRGWSIEVSPLLGDDYLLALYRKQPVAFRVLRGYWSRLRRILSRGEWDIVWVEKEVWPWCPAWFERLLRPHGCKLVVDYDDAMFHRYDQHRSAVVRHVLGHKIDAVMRDADLVLAGNGYLAERARAAGAKRIERVPTVVDLARYRLRSGQEHQVPVVGWIGSPATIRLLSPMFEVLAKLARSQKVRFTAIGARSDQVEGSPFEAIPWSEASEVDLLGQLDIGIMPLQDTPWERGKCGYKLIQYMACGLPVVASPIGVNAEMIQDGRQGFLARDANDWVGALTRLLSDPQLRDEMGAQGRALVQSQYSLESWVPRVADMLESMVQGKGESR